MNEKVKSGESLAEELFRIDKEQKESAERETKMKKSVKLKKRKQEKKLKLRN